MLLSVGDKNLSISLSRGVVVSQSTFHLVLFYFTLNTTVLLLLLSVCVVNLFGLCVRVLLCLF